MNESAQLWRIYDKVMFEPDGCWSWRGGRIVGYPYFWRDGKRRSVARLLYTKFVAVIPAGFQIHHRCQNRACVNFGHLELLTPREHRERHRDQTEAALESRRQSQRAATHCKHGHEFTTENTYWYSGWRQCRTCRNAQRR